jgi:hypothetical protein
MAVAVNIISTPSQTGELLFNTIADGFGVTIKFTGVALLSQEFGAVQVAK